ncbi:terpene synthase family protein [Streptomyces sp. NPDC002680]|uniref:terpene synthase family protein n=1 Tax=Streptomyces sp. NPDC002680 TaxID=3364659 RepID=UPI00368CD1BD
MNKRAITTTYPRSWCAGAESSSPDRYQGAERAMMSWLTGRGLISSQYSSVLERAEVARNCANSYPSATGPHLNTISKFLGLWFAFDDPAEGVGTGGRETKAGPALVGELERGALEGDPFLSAWWELGQDFKHTMSPQWRKRFSGHFEAWMYSVEDEADLSTRARKGQPPRLHEYFPVRSYSVGIDNWIDLIEYTQGRELPVDFFSDPHVREIWQLARVLHILDNDLHGITKDMDDSWLNAVFSIAHERDLSWVDGAAEAARLHEDLLGRFLHIEERARRRTGIGWWFDALHHMLAGLAVWTHSTPRYSSVHRLRGETLEVNVVFTAEPHSSPLPLPVAC